MKKTMLLLLIVPIVSIGALAQLTDTTIAPVVKQQDPKLLKLNLTDDGKQYLQFTMLNQVWLRYNDHNPGTTVMGKNADNGIDLGLRRTRFQLFGQVTDRAFIYFQFGMNNFNYLSQFAGNRKVQAFFHDALGEYRLSNNNALKIGGGLTICNGLSRFSQPSIGTIAGLDVPIFAQATVDQIDLFSRKLSLYARGQIGKLDYRVSFSDPFPVTTSGTNIPLSSQANYAQMGHSHQYQSYVMWQFWDKESHTTPYMTGTYLGKKKVLNLGAGVIYQPQATWRTENAGADTTYDDMLLWAAEAYLDAPIGKYALNAYLGYFNTNYGKDYLRYNGIMNPANGTTTSNAVAGSGPVYGNSFPMMGTGQAIYAQTALLLPGGKWLPYASLFYADFDRLKGNSMTVLDAGVSYLMTGHRSKITVAYQNRSTFTEDANGVIAGPRKGCVVVQYQLFIQ